MSDKVDKKAGEIEEQKTASYRWLNDSFYPIWEQVFQSYQCRRDPEVDPNDVQPREGQRIYDYAERLLPAGKIDLSRTSIGMPDTWALVNRMTARITAQLPNLKFRASDEDRADRISRRLMHQWDRGGVQRSQKKHVRQAALFGWSVRAWSWWENSYERTRRVDPMASDQETNALINEQYGDDINEIIRGSNDIQAMLSDPEFSQMAWALISAELLAKHARGGLLPVKYQYTKYVGPRADFLFVGDCFPEPNFPSLQESNWFIVERRRKREWLEDFRKWAKENGHNDLVNGINKLFSEKPKGSAKTIHGKETQKLRQGMFRMLERSDTLESSTEREVDAEWVITERHTPGDRTKLSMSCEGVFLGEMQYPYELEGRIAFSDLVLIDSLLDGIGDSHARIINPLQRLHDRQVCARHDLIYNIERPLVATSSQRLYENPEMLERHGGFRLVKVDDMGEIQVLGEQAAIAAAAAGLQDESGIMRQIQMATGESNMSMQANVDPQQARTATGARLMAYNQDVLSKDQIAMFNESLREDAWMMYLLNRSEMAEPAEFDGAPYIRDYRSDTPTPQREPLTVTPEDFQIDGEIDVEVGSTLADDDEAKIAFAQTIWSICSSAPQLFNMNTARDRVLKSLGEGARLAEWAAPPPEPIPPEKPRANITVSFKSENWPDEVQKAILSEANIMPPPPQPEQPQEGPPGGQPGMSPFGGMPDLAAGTGEVGPDAAYAAAKGQLSPEAA